MRKLLFSALMAAPGFLLGATFTVTNVNDSGPGSLRDAISMSNTLAGTDTVSFDASLTGQTLTLTSGEIQIRNDVIIQGPVLGDATGITIDAANSSRIFIRFFDNNLPNTELEIDSMTLINGFNSSTGGAINAFNLTIRNSQFFDNNALNMGGAASASSVTIENSVFERNNSGFDGGAVRGGFGLQVSNSVFTDNSATERGGALTGFGITLLNCQFISNTAGTAGGAISGRDISIEGSSLVNNSASSSGGGIYFDSGSGANQVIHSNFTGNDAAFGGGLFSFANVLQISNSSFSDNHAINAGDGGAMRVGGNELTINQTSIFANTAANDGGGIWAFSDEISLINSTLAGNTADNNGGALLANNIRSLLLASTTVSSNEANNGGGTGDGPGDGSGDGSGLAFVNPSFELLLTSTGSIIAGNNTANPLPTELYFQDVAASVDLIFSFTNSIVGLGFRDEDSLDMDDRNNLNTALNTGNNIESDTPMLALMFDDNGTPADTGDDRAFLEPQVDSLAVDAGHNIMCAQQPVNSLDQLGNIRPQDGDDDMRSICDIGASERVDPDFVYGTGFE